MVISVHKNVLSLTAIVECGYNNGGCSHVCKADGINHMCECFHGYELVNGTKCIGKFSLLSQSIEDVSYLIFAE